MTRAAILHDGRWLRDEFAEAAVVLWASGRFDTAQIALVLGHAEDAVVRTLHFAKDLAAQQEARP